MKEQVAAAERQMQAWAFAQEIGERSLRFDREHRSPPKGEFITLSREAGSSDEEIAAMVGRALGWEVLDKNLIEKIAERFGLEREMLAMVDETQVNWAYDLLGAWLDKRIVPHEKFVYLLGRIVITAARRGKVVFVGRGAQFFLPQDQGLRVRIIATERYRVQEIMHRFHLTEDEARRFMIKTDRGRAQIVREFFNHDINDPYLYDLVVNVAKLGPQCAAETIVQAYRQRPLAQAKHKSEHALA